MNAAGLHDGDLASSGDAPPDSSVGADSFEQAFADVAAMLFQGCGAELIWKDVDPGRWSRWPKALCQHQGKYCQAVKSDPCRLSACISADTAEPNHDQPEARTCPFGVTEMIVPFRRHGALLGWCFVGLATTRRPERTDVGRFW